ncbi:hypothetical protein [Neisseria bacilliformis]|nr:hypothetical protein [Neisseria bacilliformis]
MQNRLAAAPQRFPQRWQLPTLTLPRERERGQGFRRPQRPSENP